MKKVARDQNNLLSRLLYELCESLCKGSSKAYNIAHIYSVASQSLIKREQETTDFQDEIGVVYKITSLLKESSEEDLLTFLDLHRKLSSSTVLTKRAEILQLLISLSQYSAKQSNKKLEMAHKPSEEECINQSPSNLCWDKLWRSTNGSNCSSDSCTPEAPKVLRQVYQANGTASGSRAVSSPAASPYNESASSAPGIHTRGSRQDYPSIPSRSASCTSTVFDDKVFMSPAMTPRQSRPDQPGLKLHSNPSWRQEDFTERELIQELLYCFQGIEGKVLKPDPDGNGFMVDPKINLKIRNRQLLQRLAAVGWLHNMVRDLHDHTKKRAMSLGLIAQALKAFMADELTELYRLVAILQSRLTSKNMDSVQIEMTLLQLQVYVNEPRSRFYWLASVFRQCKDKKGGTIASVIYGYFAEMGHPPVKQLMGSVLVAACRPLYAMCRRWLLDGELEDPFDEFFIGINAHIKDNNQLWHEKYTVREKLVPAFIPMEEASKILAAGKSINFLREVCEDLSPIKSRQALKKAFDDNDADAIFFSENESNLQELMATAYLEVSRKVLDTLNSKYKLMEHMQALRRYLLLGQGDFIRHLMSLVEMDLRKPATDIFPHTLHGVLESAIRATNAQFEDASILARLDTRLMEASAGDTGWDLFSLEYNVEGPIGTVFSSSRLSYLTLFNALWRAKRIEWILSQMWKRLITSTKMHRNMPELEPIQQQMNLLSSEMIHLMHQLEYYFLFEVVECSWDELIKKVQESATLDDVISAHDQFLVRVKAGVFVDESSQEIATQLRAIYGLVIGFQGEEEQFHARVNREVERRMKYDQLVEEQGTCNELEAKNDQATKDFTENFLNKTKLNIRLLAKSYQDVVKRFLLLLATHYDVNLQNLSKCMDFNDHYKKLDRQLAASHTYHSRRSDAFTSFSFQ